MKRAAFMFLAAAVATSLRGETLAESEDVAFRLYIAEDSVYSLTNAADAAIWKVTWQDGETVDATAMDGTAYTLSEGAASTSAILPSKGGVWKLSNSEAGKATICVPWAAYNDGGTFMVPTASLGAFFVDTVQDGPDRKLKKREVPPIAYSGDDWAGDISKAATVTFTPPEGSGLEATTWNKTGTGAQSFTFNAKGVWTVTLTFADNTTRTAHIDIQASGFMIIVK